MRTLLVSGIYKPDIGGPATYIPKLAEKIITSEIIRPIGILKSIPKTEYDAMIEDIAIITDEFINNYKKENQIQLYNLMSKLKEYLSKDYIKNIGITFSDDFIKSQLILAMAHGVIMKICKENFMNVMDQAVSELFRADVFKL